MAFNTINRDLTARFHLRHGVYSGPSVYATGGDIAGGVLNALGLSRIESAPAIVARNAANAIRLIMYDPTADSALWFDPTTGLEIAAGTDLSGFDAYYVVYGI